ncbi:MULTISPECIES: hypothetical protein [Cupriavidus]|uniref:hypothetical protein n=1 Tax=Cupriavidus sp. DF5525 TaxID=3160989 RepID=UPI0003B0B6D7|nr:hypothetical protein N234_22900 [Ralstonia pickettii DTP0602]
MIHDNKDTTFRGLPLTAEQNSEIRHYFKRKARLGQPWNTPELHGMLEDMLLPPSTEDDNQGDIPPDAFSVAERAAAFIDQEMEPIEAYEEWHAAMEAESMKGGMR